MISQVLIHTDPRKREEKAVRILEENGLNRNHPNLLWPEEEKLGIEQIRKVKDFLSLKPYQGKHQAVVILLAENLTPEAQNAFLKTLEEPSEDAIIILGVSSEDQLLPTIISRCQIISLENSSPKTSQLGEKSSKKMEKLICSSLEERFQLIEKTEDKGELLQDLIIYFRDKLIENPKTDLNFISDLIEAEKFAKQNVNIRAILEYLMLKMPENRDLG